MAILGWLVVFAVAVCASFGTVFIWYATTSFGGKPEKAPVIICALVACSFAYLAIHNCPFEIHMK